MCDTQYFMIIGSPLLYVMSLILLVYTEKNKQKNNLKIQFFLSKRCYVTSFSLSYNIVVTFATLQ